MLDHTLNRTLDPRDHMFNTGPEWYWRVGESGLLAVQQVLSLAYNQPVRRVLDLPCGHGRVGRYLRAGFPDAQMFFCDIDIHGAEFCAWEIGGEAIASKPELRDVSLPNDCDVIWIGSLFTHLDQERTERWLRHLCGALSKTGVLVATFHGRWSIEVQRQSPMIDEASWSKAFAEYEETGFGYARFPYASGADFGVAAADYGISIARPSVVVGMVEKIPGVRLLSYTERGWAGNHDVLGVGGLDRLTPW